MNVFTRKKRIYLDYASTTPVDKRVERVMAPFGRDFFGNPSSIHKEGVVAREAVLSARIKIARALKVRSEEIIFTSGGTEANNLAIRGVVESLRQEGVAYKNMHIITSIVEHVSVLHCVHALEREGVQVTYLGVDGRGHIDKKELEEALCPATVLVSLMYVNNEIGTITALRKISTCIRSYRKEKRSVYPFFHTDASQAPLYLDCSPESLGIDLLTIDAQKIYGPKGVGFLFKRHGVSLSPIFYGGGQENSLRPGTEPVALIVGLAEAFAIAEREHKEEALRVSGLRDFFITRLESEVPQAKLNGSAKERIANNINISIPGIDSEFLIIKLDQAGVASSGASACLSKSEEGSYVVKALASGGQGRVGYANSTVRFTLGRETKRQEIEAAISILVRCLKS